MGGYRFPGLSPGGRGGTAEIFATVIGALKQGAEQRRSREEAERQQRLSDADTKARGLGEYALNHPEDRFAAEAAAAAQAELGAVRNEVIAAHMPKKGGPLQQILRNLGFDLDKGRGKGKGEARQPWDERPPVQVPGMPTPPTAGVPPTAPPSAVTAQVPAPAAQMLPPPVPGVPGTAPAVPPGAEGARGVPSQLPDIAAIMAQLGRRSPAPALAAQPPAAAAPAVAPLVPPPTPPVAAQAPAPTEAEPRTSAEYAMRQARRAGTLGEAQYTGQLAEARYQAQLTEVKRKVMDGTATPQERDTYYRATGTDPYAARYQSQIDEANAVLTDPNATPDQRAAAQQKFEQASKARSASLGYYVQPPRAPAPTRPTGRIQEAMLRAGVAPDRALSSLSPEELSSVQVTLGEDWESRNALTEARTEQAHASTQAARARATSPRLLKGRTFQNMLTNFRMQMSAERPIAGMTEENIEKARRQLWGLYSEVRRKNPQAGLPEGAAYPLSDPRARVAANDIEVVVAALAAEEAAGAAPLAPPGGGPPGPSAGQLPPGWTP